MADFIAMPRPVHFEIHVDDADRAIRFYQELFGWTFTKWDGPMPYWLVTTGPEGTPGINGGLHPRKGPRPEDGQAVIGYVCTVNVENLDAFVQKALRLGSSLCVPKRAVPGVGWLAYAKDSEGNIFGLMQNDPAAC